MEKYFPLKAGFKADLTLKMEIGNARAELCRSKVILPSLTVSTEWKSESLKLCPRLLERRAFPEVEPFTE